MYPSNKVIKQQAKVARWFFFTLSVFVFLFVNAYILMPQATDVPLIAQVGDSEVNLGTSGGQFGCGLNDIEFVNFVHEYCEAPFWDEAGFSSAEACFEDAFDARGTNCDEEDFGTDSGATCAEVIADCQRATGGSSADLQQCVSDKKPSCVGLGDDQPDGPTTGDDQPDGPTAGGQGRPSVSVISLTNPLKAESVQDLILAVVKTVLKLAIPIAVLFIIWSGFKFVMAQGNPEKIKGAIKTFQWTVIGLAVIFGAYVIATIIKSTIESFY